MDEDKDLIDRLCTLAGMIMENVSAEAVGIEAGRDRLSAKIERIRNSATDVAALADAAAVVLRRFVEP